MIADSIALPAMGRETLRLGATGRPRAVKKPPAREDDHRFSSWSDADARRAGEAIPDASPVVRQAAAVILVLGIVNATTCRPAGRSGIASRTRRASSHWQNGPQSQAGVARPCTASPESEAAVDLAAGQHPRLIAACYRSLGLDTPLRDGDERLKQQTWRGKSMLKQPEASK